MIYIIAKKFLLKIKISSFYHVYTNVCYRNTNINSWRTRWKKWQLWQLILWQLIHILSIGTTNNSKKRNGEKYREDIIHTHSVYYKFIYL